MTDAAWNALVLIVLIVSVVAYMAWSTYLDRKYPTE